MVKKVKWKGVNIKKQMSNKIVNKVKNVQFVNKCNTILPKFINKTVLLYNGKVNTKLIITKYMISYKVGEFVRTRKEFFFKKKKNGSKN